MKIECDLERIKKAVSYAERITGKNLTLPVLDSILITAGDKSIKLKAINLSLGIDIEVPAKVFEEGILAVSGSTLNNTLSNIFDKGKVSLEENQGGLIIKTQKSQIKIKGVPYEDFPTIPAVSGESFEVDSRKIVEGLRSVYYSASPSDIKPEISSVYIYTNNDDVVFVSTDSFRLAEKKIKIKKPIEISGILIPFKNISEIVRVLGEVNETVEICFNKNQISFSTEDIYLTSRVIDGIFPDYNQIVPSEFKTEVVVLKEDLLNALKLSNIFSDKFNQLNLYVKVGDKKLEMTSENSNVGDNKTSIDAVLKGQDVEISFNYKYFLDCFQSINTDSLTIRLNDSNEPIFISPVSDSSFMYLIMPMNR